MMKALGVCLALVSVLLVACGTSEDALYPKEPIGIRPMPVDKVIAVPAPSATPSPLPSIRITESS